jgi:hypothetical protein
MVSPGGSTGGASALSQYRATRAPAGTGAFTQTPETTIATRVMPVPRSWIHADGVKRPAAVRAGRWARWASSVSGGHAVFFFTQGTEPGPFPDEPPSVALAAGALAFVGCGVCFQWAHKSIHGRGTGPPLPRLPLQQGKGMHP